MARIHVWHIPLIMTLIVIALLCQHLLRPYIENYWLHLSQQQRYDQALKKFFIAEAANQSVNIYQATSDDLGADNKFTVEQANFPHIAQFTHQDYAQQVLEALQLQLRQYEIQQSLNTALPTKAPHYHWPVAGLSAKTSQVEYPDNFPGIHIAADEGTPVLSIESGSVVHVETTNNGYGVLIIVQHSDNLLAVYAKNRHSLVNKGEQVKRGQQLGESGTTHLHAHPGLYFEIRHNGAAENPFLYLAGL